MLASERRLLLARARFQANRAPHLAACIDITVPRSLLAAAMLHLKSSCPNTVVDLHHRSRDAALEEVLHRRAEIALVVGPLQPTEGLVARPVAAVKYVPAVSPAHPLGSNVRPVGLGELRQHTELVVEERDLGGREHRPAIRFALNCADTLYRLLRAGAGWAIVPLGDVAADIEQGHLRIVDLEAPVDDRLVHVIAREPLGDTSKEARQLIEGTVQAAATSARPARGFLPSRAVVVPAVTLSSQQEF